MPNPKLEEAQAVLPELVTLRRSIHEESELGLQTPRTEASVLSSVSLSSVRWLDI